MLNEAQRQTYEQLRAQNAARRAAESRRDYVDSLPTWARRLVLEQVRAHDAACRAKSAAALTTPPPPAAASGGNVGGSGDESHFRIGVGGIGNESYLHHDRERVPGDPGYNPYQLPLDSLGDSIGRSSSRTARESTRARRSPRRRPPRQSCSHSHGRPGNELELAAEPGRIGKREELERRRQRRGRAPVEREPAERVEQERGRDGSVEGGGRAAVVAAVVVVVRAGALRRGRCWGSVEGRVVHVTNHQHASLVNRHSPSRMGFHHD
jgi:hypothetical protein